jgi:phosphotransferase system HPr (HPr) family protein
MAKSRVLTGGGVAYMVEKETTIGAAEGLHARPAAEFVQKAKGFSSEIVVVKDGREANAKSPLKLMTLAAKHGEQITVRGEGDDAEEAVSALIELISTEE